MFYIFFGFLFGVFIPYMARRFAKFMPATPGYALYRLVWPVKSVSDEKKRNNPCYQKLMSAYVMRSLGYGIVSAAVSYAAVLRFGVAYVWWYLAFIWVLLLLQEIDYKTMYLPDILTMPLLLAGFLYSVLIGAWVGPAESSIGAVAGYILPVVASLFLVWKNKDVFGGGDIKLLAAVGAWLGVEPLLFVVVLSCAVFAGYALLKRQRSGAFGPAITVAAIIVAFYVQ